MLHGNRNVFEECIDLCEWYYKVNAFKEHSDFFARFELISSLVCFWVLESEFGYLKLDLLIR